MPHCIIEHSTDLLTQVSTNQLIHEVFKSASKSGLFEDTDIKMRSTAFEHYRIGIKKASFIHVVVKILDGRTLEQRRTLSHSILESLQTLPLKETSISVDIIEMESASYAKTTV